MRTVPVTRRDGTKFIVEIPPEYEMGRVAVLPNGTVIIAHIAKPPIYYTEEGKWETLNPIGR